MFQVRFELATLLVILDFLSSIRIRWKFFLSYPNKPTPLAAVSEASKLWAQLFSQNPFVLNSPLYKIIPFTLKMARSWKRRTSIQHFAYLHHHELLEWFWGNDHEAGAAVTPKYSTLWLLWTLIQARRKVQNIGRAIYIFASILVNLYLILNFSPLKLTW